VRVEAARLRGIGRSAGDGLRAQHLSHCASPPGGAIQDGDWHALAHVVATTLDHHSQETTHVRWVTCMFQIALGTRTADTCSAPRSTRPACRRWIEVRNQTRESAACAAVVERAIERWDRIDVLVNNAGIIRDSLLGLLTPEDVQDVLDTNVAGVFNVTHAVVPHMISRRAGRIINISSVSGDKGGRGQTNYAASKGAINALTRALAVELAPRKIAVNAVAPGVIETDMSQAVRDLAAEEVKSRILLRRFGSAQEVAFAVWFLASKFSDYITGQVLCVDGGFKME